VDFGADFGGAFFDEQILAYTLEHNADGDIRPLIQRSENAYLLPVLKFRCRKAKEAYFNDPDSFAEESPKVNFERIGNRIFQPIVNGEVMRQFLTQPLQHSSLSWPETFKQHLEQVKEKLTQDNVPLTAVLLTGGAARMGFTHDLIRQTLVTGAIKFKPDQDPALSIARGLALWGRRRYLIDSFVQEVRQVFESAMPNLILRHQGSLLDLLLSGLTEKAIEEFAVPAIFEWKEGKIESTQALRQRIKDQTDAWLKSPEGAEFLASVSNRWWGEVLEEFRPILDSLCKQYDVPAGSLNLQLPFHAGDYFNPAIPVPVPLEPLFRILGYIIFWAIVWVLPLGGPIIAAFITWLFKDELDEFIDKQMQKIETIPGFMRRLISDDKIRRIGRENKNQITDKMKTTLLRDETAMATMRSQLLDHLRLEVEKQAHEAARLIQFQSQ
jgi:hypothetical protein